MPKENAYKIISEKLIFIKPGKVVNVPVKLPKKIPKDSTGRIAVSGNKAPMIIINSNIDRTCPDEFDLVVQNPSDRDIFIGKGDQVGTMTITVNSN